MENVPVAVTMTVANWNRVLQLLSKAPFDQVADLIGGTQQQISAALQSMQPQQDLKQEAQKSAPNGAGASKAN